MIEKTDVSLPLEPNTWDPQLVELYNYWKSIKPSPNRLPSRQDFDPMDVPKLLPILWMFDVHHHPLRFKFRLLGTSITPIVGKEATNEWLDEAFPEVTATGVYEDYTYVAQSCSPLYRKGSPQYFVPDYKSIERLILPLVDKKGKCEILLGISVYT